MTRHRQPPGLHSAHLPTALAEASVSRGPIGLEDCPSVFGGALDQKLRVYWP